VVRNAYLPARETQTGIGPVTTKVPRAQDRQADHESVPVRFKSFILPPHLRKTRNTEELIPWRYLKGISTGDFTETLSLLLDLEKYSTTILFKFSALSVSCPLYDE